jgi:predicted aldo/keto reductase-like oxidoreductase
MKISRKMFLRSLLGMAGAGFCRRHSAAAGIEPSTLAFKALGRTGLRVTALGLGAPRTDEPALVREFFRRAKTAGKVRACGISTHKNHLALLEKVLHGGFYEVVMLPFNPFGGFRHSIGGWLAAWDQEGLIKVMERAQAAGIGIVAMKTCSGGPFAPRPGDQPSLADAVRWVTEKPYIASAAVAMSSFTQLEEHVTRHCA